jgi:hypothetical protein
MCKILLITFRGFACAFYNSLSSIDEFSDLYAKLVAHFNTSISTKKSFTKLFIVIQQKSKSTRASLKRFNDEMFKVEGLL